MLEIMVVRHNQISGTLSLTYYQLWFVVYDDSIIAINVGSQIIYNYLLLVG